MTVNNDVKSLYDTDIDRWLERTITLLKENRLDELDREHLIEELEELGRRNQKTIERLIEQIIRHLLLLQYRTSEHDRNANHWKAEILGFRTHLNEDLTRNLENHLRENQTEIYEKALRYVRQKTGYEVTFPEECPYTLDRAIGTGYRKESSAFS